MMVRAFCAMARAMRAQLALSARYLRVGAMTQMGDAHALERIPRPVDVHALRRGEQTYPAARAHQHHVEHVVGVSGRMRLRDVGDLARALADGDRAHVLPVHADAARPAVVEAQDASEQGRFAYAVGPEHVHQRVVGDAEAQVAQHMVAAVREAEVLDIDAHSPCFLLVMRYRKNGAPTNAVRMPMGISELATRRATSSTMSRKLAPMSMLAGSSLR